ncbi:MULTISPECIES: hypothetical protein [Legionella]|uniref:Uncharacterized protein n=1 Tax=Legionella maceachernii TaxID=466 RepID=A0A0W0W0I2_9GAMM|nr:hypothetical protein [Legionella maceachernii]KTD25884.1 hypothetical protein Lmac_1655 [Legionella maceachernii]SJZ47660.1 hypothetical protein SAMN02745128_00162 [Legionella maceachernii]SUP03894.1 Uncharacterised protein [Legionella maceachernii]
MNRMLKGLVATTLSLSATVVLAHPTDLIIRNTTDVEMNEYIDGIVPAIPTPAKSVGTVPWTLIEMACYGYTLKGKCSALIKLATDTNKPFKLGTITIDMETGEISPQSITGPKGYKFKATGPGKATLIQE